MSAPSDHPSVHAGSRLAFVHLFGRNYIADRQGQNRYCRSNLHPIRLEKASHSVKAGDGLGLGVENWDPAYKHQSGRADAVLVSGILAPLISRMWDAWETTKIPSGLMDDI